MRDQPRKDLQTFPVRSRSTVHGDGEVEVHRTVGCPHRGTLAAVECEHCTRCHTIVVDELGRPAQIVCRPETEAVREEARTRLPSAADRTRISTIMSRNVMCVSGDVSVEALTALFLDRRLGAVPIVDDEGRPLGVVTKTDLVRQHQDDGDLTQLGGGDGYSVRELATALARDVMTPFAFTLREEEPLSRAAALMALEQLHHLPVVAMDGRVVGLLSSQDFVRWIAQTSGYLR